jgi:signal transduction histidine kinase
MRLWQRIFLLTTAMVILGISSVSYVVLNNDFNTTLINLRENTNLILDNTGDNIQASIFTHRAKNNNFILPQTTVENLTNQVCTSHENKNIYVSCTANPLNNLYSYTKNLYAYHTTTYVKENNTHYIVSSKPIMIEGAYYTLTIKHNITQTFIQFDTTISYVRNATTFIATFIAFVLLFIIQLIMRPIKNINNATKLISDGNYQYRIKTKDTSEIGEVAVNMNNMASAIEKNIAYIESIADSRLTFISNMTHELKTPLTSILGFANIMVVKAEISDKERREYAKIIESETIRLKTLTSKLMELVSLRNAELETKPENIKTVLLEVFSSFSTIFKSKQISLKVFVDELPMNMDKELFKSLIYNLLDNAVKASPINSLIEVYAKKVIDHIEIQIKDYGIGISKEKLPHVTEAFFMANKTQARKVGGAGIGLSLCKEICKVHHGSLFITSEYGTGTIVRLIFPITSKGGLDEN